MKFWVDAQLSPTLVSWTRRLRLGYRLETSELVESAGYGHIKEIVKQDAVTLTV